MLCRHCHQLLLNLLIVLGQHSDHLTVSSILMNGQIEQTGFGLCLPTLPIVDHDFTNSPPSSRLNSSDGGCGDVSSEVDNRSEDLNVGGASGTVSEDEAETSYGYVAKILLYFLSVIV